MRVICRIVCGVMLIAFVLGSSVAVLFARQSTAAPDMIFFNGDLLTMAGDDWAAQAIAIQGEEILAVGSDAEILPLQGRMTRLVDLGGQTLMPGFVDAHTHIFGNSYANDDLAAAQAYILAVGTTTLGDAFVPEDMVERMRALDAAGNLHIRTSLYLAYTNACGELQGDWYLRYPPTFEPGEMLRIGGVKIYTDGGSCGVPAYSFDHPVLGYGDLWFTQDELNAMVSELDAQGYPMLIHALGDRAVEQVLNAYEALFATKPNTLHHRIDHNAIVRPDMLTRYSTVGALPVIFGAYPACNTSFAPPPLETQAWEWPWRALLDANPGVRFAWKSDHPVTAASPLLNLYSLVTLYEVNANGIDTCPTPDWLAPNKLLTVREVLPMMTINGAYALNRENEVGSLEPGK